MHLASLQVVATLKQKLKELPGGAQRDWVLDKLAGMKSSVEESVNTIPVTATPVDESAQQVDLEAEIQAEIVNPAVDVSTGDQGSGQGSSAVTFAVGGAAGAAIAAAAIAGVGLVRHRDGSRLAMRRASGVSTGVSEMSGGAVTTARMSA